MYCFKCGNKIVNDERICPVCGAVQEPVAPPGPAAGNAEQTTAFASPAAAAPPGQGQGGFHTVPNKKNGLTPAQQKKRGLKMLMLPLSCGVTALAVLIAALVVVLIVVLGKMPAKETRLNGDDVQQEQQVKHNTETKPDGSQDYGEPTLENFMLAMKKNEEAMFEHEVSYVEVKNKFDEKELRIYENGNSSADYYLTVIFEDETDIAKKVSIAVRADLATELMQQNDANLVIGLMIPSIAAYINVADGSSITMDEVAELIANNANNDGTSKSSEFTVGGATVSMEIYYERMTGWTAETEITTIWAKSPSEDQGRDEIFDAFLAAVKENEKHIFEQDILQDIAQEITADEQGNTEIRFYHKDYGEDVFTVRFFEGNNIRKGIQVRLSELMTNDLMSQNDQVKIIAFMTPAVTAYLNVIEGDPITMDQLQMQIYQTTKHGEHSYYSSSEVGGSEVEMGIGTWAEHGEKNWFAVINVRPKSMP